MYNFLLPLCGEIKITNWPPCWIFKSIKFYVQTRSGRSTHITMPNFLETGLSKADIFTLVFAFLRFVCRRKVLWRASWRRQWQVAPHLTEVGERGHRRRCHRLIVRFDLHVEFGVVATFRHACVHCFVLRHQWGVLNVGVPWCCRADHISVHTTVCQTYCQTGCQSN